MVYVELTGRLGNELFQVAAAASMFGMENIRGYIKSYQSKIAYERSKEIFQNLLIVDELPTDTVRCEEGCFSYSATNEKRIRQILKRGGVLSGLFQSEKWFDVNLVRKLYRADDDRRRWLFDKYGDWLCRPNVTGVSVRRGDFLHWPERFPFVGCNYFKDCFSRLVSVNDFIVCSDDIVWCRKFFTTNFPGKNFLFVEDETILNQLYLQALCCNNILSNSTFSWWGGWLNEFPKKRVLAPSEWFGVLLKKQGFDWSNIYFDGVEVVDNSSRCFLLNKSWWCYQRWRVKRILSPVKRSFFKLVIGRTHLLRPIEGIDIDK